MPFFTLITVCYDNIKGLRATRDSIQAQGFRDFEWIVIDGLSSDGTAEMLQATDAQWISEPDQGIYDAMNKGLARAGGAVCDLPECRGHAGRAGRSGPAGRFYRAIRGGFHLCRFVGGNRRAAPLQDRACRSRHQDRDDHPSSGDGLPAGGVSQQNALQGRLEQFGIRRSAGTVPPLTNASIFTIQAVL